MLYNVYPWYEKEKELAKPLTMWDGDNVHTVMSLTVREVLSVDGSKHGDLEYLGSLTSDVSDPELVATMVRQGVVINNVIYPPMSVLEAFTMYYHMCSDCINLVNGLLKGNDKFHDWQDAYNNFKHFVGVEPSGTMCAYCSGVTKVRSWWQQPMTEVEWRHRETLKEMYNEQGKQEHTVLGRIKHWLHSL